MACQEAGQQQNIRPKVLDEDLQLGYTRRTAGNRVAWEGEPGAEGYLHLLVCYLKLISDWKQATRIICNTSRDAEAASPWGSVKNWCHSEFIITWPTMKLTVPMTPPHIEYWMTFIWADFLFNSLQNSWELTCQTKVNQITWFASSLVLCTQSETLVQWSLDRFPNRIYVPKVFILPIVLPRIL